MDKYIQKKLIKTSWWNWVQPRGCIWWVSIEGADLSPLGKLPAVIHIDESGQNRSHSYWYWMPKTPQLGTSGDKHPYLEGTNLVLSVAYLKNPFWKNILPYNTILREWSEVLDKPLKGLLDSNFHRSEAKCWTTHLEKWWNNNLMNEEAFQRLNKKNKWIELGQWSFQDRIGKQRVTLTFGQSRKKLWEEDQL